MKHGKKFISLVLALIMICGLAVSASAADAQNVTAQLSPGITVQYNGETQNMADANGNPVYPVIYEGTTYLPIRAVSNMLGVAVDWDQATKTVLLSDTDNPADYAKADPNAAKPAAANITVRLSPDITVKYNNAVQTMTDISGNTVYPVSYNSTTYLPIRAVSNMLGIAVGWEQATKIVRLVDSSANEGGEDMTISTPAGNITINTGNKEGAYQLLADAGFDEATATAILAQVEFITSDPLGGFQTSSDAEFLGEKHIGYDYAEIDWSTSDDGYIKIKINEYVTKRMFISVDSDSDSSGGRWVLTEGMYVNTDGWVNIPLYGGTAEYAVSVDPLWTEDDDNRTYYEQPLQVRFEAEFDESKLWLLSTVNIDYENAPLTTAKALELTKNCKSDAEKIKAIFNYVSSTIKYDYALRDEAIAYTIENKENPDVNTLTDRFQDGARDYLVLDDILTSKSGVCEDFATLMVGMLRSLGIPCKYVSGDAYTGNVIEGFSDDGWAPHGWVAISPDVTGLNKTALGAGTDEDGWIRLDPTNASNKSWTSNDANYRADNWY